MNAAPDDPRPEVLESAADHDKPHVLMVGSAAAIIRMCAVEIRAGVPQDRQEFLTRAMRDIRHRRDAVSPQDEIAALSLHRQFQQLILVLGTQGGPPIAANPNEDQRT